MSVVRALCCGGRGGASCPWCRVKMLGSAYQGAEGLDAWLVETHKC